MYVSYKWPMDEQTDMGQAADEQFLFWHEPQNSQIYTKWE